MELTMQLDHTRYLDKSSLFWGNQKLQGLITPEQQIKLCDLEFHEWISSLYWGEGIAMNYALKMSEISEDQEKWLQVYSEEHRHQTIISNWFIENKLTPLPKSRFIEHAFRKVDLLNSAYTDNELISTIYDTQVLYEELFHFLLKIRTKDIIDRDLKSIFYQIFRDESAHLTNARVEIRTRGQSPRKLYETVEKYASRIFPLEISKKILSPEQLKEVSKIQKSIVIESIELAKSSSKIYVPVSILESFQKIPGYNCVGCSPLRADGLHLEPKFNEVDNIAEDILSFPKRCEGFNSVVHGGYIAMALDEIMVYASILQNSHLAMTSELKVEYKRPIITNTPYKIEGKVISQDGQRVQTIGFIKDTDNSIVAQSEAVLFIPTKSQAGKILGELGKHDVVSELCYK